MIDVVALGELLIDFTPAGLSEQGALLLARNAGGAPANVLAMLSILEKKTAFIGKVGQDGFGFFLKKTLETSMGKERVKIMDKPSQVSEEFANFLYHVPGAIMWLGCSSDESTSYALHHPKFNMDEAALAVGVAAHVTLADRFLDDDVEFTFANEG